MNQNVKLKQNNQGSTIIIVLVAMAFIGVLASLVLSVSLTNYQVKTVDRKAKENFYSAEVVLDEVKAGLEELVSEQLVVAYQEVLKQYAQLPIGERNEKFRKIFVDKLQASLWMGPTAPNDEKYNISMIEGYTTVTGADIVSSSNVLEKEFVPGDVNKQYVQIKNLDITYLDSTNHYKTNITTDIKIVAPALEVESIGSKPSFCDYALISDQTISVNLPVTKYVVTGDVYGAERILAKSPGSLVALNANNVVTRNSIEIADNANLLIGSVTAPAKIWVKNIETTASSSALVGAKATLTGDTYVLDDLTLNAKSSEVSIKGGYYGYGYGTEAKQSSAILINKSNCKLDLSAMNKFFLAGRAFISHDSGFGSVEVATGESISTKPNQNAYLLPGESIMNADGTKVGHNPILPGEVFSLQNSSNPALSVNMNHPSFNGQVLSYFASGCKVIYDSEGLVYFYIKFIDENKANEYYKAFYEAEKDSIDAHLIDFETRVIEPTTLPFLRQTNAGNIILMNGTTSQLLSSTLTDFLPTTFAYEAASLSKQYAAMQETLMLSKENSPAKNPASLYNSLINQSDIHGLESLVGVGNTEKTFISEDESHNPIGQIVLVHNTSYIVNTAPTLPTILIATGNVELNCPSYNGIVIAKGNITIKAAGESSITAPDSNLVYEIISNSDAITAFLDYQKFSKSPVAAGALASNQINISDYISYVNWKKN